MPSWPSRCVARRAGREDHVAGAVEAAQRQCRQRLELAPCRSAGRRKRRARCGSCRPPVDRAPAPAARRRGPPGRAADVHQVVAALGDGVDDRRNARDTDLEAAVEGDVDLGDRAQPAVDVGVGSDHLDVEAAHAALADLLERVGHAVHPADPVGDQRHARPVALAAGQLGLLAPQKRRRGCVRDRRNARVEQPQRAVRRDRQSPRWVIATISSTAPASLRSWMRRARR